MLAMAALLVSGASMRATAATAPTLKATEDTIVVGGGCFWGIEAVYRNMKGVKSAVSGYSNGKNPNPTYKDVSGGKSGYAEVVQVVYDPSQVSLTQILEVLLTTVSNPTELNRQGNDIGTQYRSAIFYRNAAQKKATDALIAQLTKAKTFKAPIVTDVAPLQKFYAAEAEHQNYVARNPKDSYVVANDAPKVDRFKKKYPQLVRK